MCDHAGDLVLASHDVAGVQHRRRNALLHHGWLRVDQRFARLGWLHPRQLHHAVGDDAAGAPGAAAFAEGVQRSLARALRRILAPRPLTQLVQVFEQPGHFAEAGVCGVGVVVKIIIVGERVEGDGFGAWFIIREGVEGDRFGGLDVVVVVWLSHRCPPSGTAAAAVRIQL